MPAQGIDSLSKKIDELIKLCEALDAENRQLRSESLNWERERRELVNKNQQAREKVGGMIERLRNLEQES